MILDDNGVWTDCPFQDKLPAYVRVKVEKGALVLYSSKHELSVGGKFRLGEGEDFNFARDVLPMMNLLAQTCFDDEFPGEYHKMVLRRMTASSGEELKADTAKWTRYRELGADISAA